MIVRIRNKILLLFFIIIISNLSAQNAVIKSIEIQGNKFFDRNQYLNWIGININQRIFPGVVDTIINRISKNLVLNGFHLFDITKVETDTLD
ncbi:MAG: hypothetical protein ACUVT3_00935 [Ignavibacterium sp.]